MKLCLLWDNHRVDEPRQCLRGAIGQDVLSKNIAGKMVPITHIWGINGNYHTGTPGGTRFCVPCLHEKVFLSTAYIVLTLKNPALPCVDKTAL